MQLSANKAFHKIICGERRESRMNLLLFDRAHWPKPPKIISALSAKLTALLCHFCLFNVKTTRSTDNNNQTFFSLYRVHRTANQLE